MDLAVAHAIAGAGAIEQIGRVAHALHAAGDDDAAEPARIRSWANIAAFMPEPHILLMVVAPADERQSGADRRLTAGAWPWPAGSTQPMMTSSTRVGRESRPRQRGLDRLRAELRGGNILQIAEKSAHRRARRAGDDDWVLRCHGFLSLKLGRQGSGYDAGAKSAEGMKVSELSRRLRPPV